MKNKHLLYVFAVVCILLPSALLQFNLILGDWLAESIILVAFLVIFYCVLLLSGILKQSIPLILIFPLSICLFIGFLKLKNHLEKISDLNAKILIRAIDKFKEQNGKYPDTLILLKGKYFDRMPVYWRGLIPSNYLYHHYPNDSYFITQKFTQKSIKIWRSSDGGWEYYGPYKD